MKRFAFTLLGFVLFPLSKTEGQGYPMDAGVDVVHYIFNITLSDATDEIQGRADIAVRFVEGARSEFTLDLIGVDTDSSKGMEVQSVFMGGEPVQFSHENDRLTMSLPSPSEPEEQVTFSVVYGGIPQDGLIIGTNLHGERTFFGDNWPDRARHWLPTVDHVSDKATVEWIVTAPEDYEVVATGVLRERSDLPDGTELTHWVSDIPISPKVMVMGAARFAIRTTGYVGDIPIQSWVYPEDRVAGFHDFSAAQKVVEFFQDLIGPFPYEKMANVQSKTRYGGMENAGNIFYSERAVRGDGRNEGLIAHEIAHQWFGDSVTEMDWNHIWLSEGFATYFTHIYNEFNYGEDRLVEGMERDRITVTRFLAENPDLPLVPPEYDDPNRMLNRNAYQKGGWTLHMLRRQVGDDAFFAGIRDYYGTYRDGNALTEDFQRIMEKASGQELGWFFHQWAYVAGHPVLDGDWSFDAASGELSVSIRQVQPRDHAFRFPLEISAVSEDGSEELFWTVEVTKTEETFTIPLSAPPAEVVLDPHTWLLFEGGLNRR